jgi:hypothetical protein
MSDAETITTTNPHDTIQRYLQFWNTEPGVEQRELGRRVFNRLVTYRAPIGSRTGIDELATLATGFAEQLGGLTMQARAEPEVHDDCARLRWELLRQGASFAEGTDVLTFDITGRVASVATFLDRAPEGFDPHAQHLT